LKHLTFHYIYPIFYKIAKKANPRKKIYPIENCRYEIKAKMLAVSKAFRPVDILTVLLQITTATKPPIRVRYLLVLVDFMPRYIKLGLE
jgi:hypothetical protein